MSESIEEIERKLEQKADETNYVSVTELPIEITAKIESAGFRNDKRGNEAFFLTLMLEDKRIVAQKYTRTCYKHLVDAIKACGGFRALMQNFTIWRKERVGRALNDRFYPVPTANPEKKKKQ